jgi:hypothetical protein
MTLRRWSLRVLLIAILLGSGAFTLQPHAPVAAQTGADFWGEPVNLSRSGSAETPVIATAPDGAAQVLWWDRFDGLLTAISAGPEAPWSAPQPAPLGLTRVVGEGDEAVLETIPLTQMPQLLPDARGSVHAWWLGAVPDTANAAATAASGQRALWYSRLRVGQTTWSTPDTLAEAALVWRMAEAADGSLHLVYLRPVNTTAFPAGLYYKRSTDGGATWSAPALVASSLYFRLLDASSAGLTVQAVGDEIFAAWQDPRSGRPLLARSTDGGATWTPPEPLTAETSARAPQLLPFRRISAFYEAGQPCVLYRQALELDLDSPAVIFEGANVCGQTLQLLPLAGDQALLVAGAGSGSLTLALWDGARFSEPKALSASFRDPELERQIVLDSFSVARQGGNLIVAGLGQDGEIWTLAGALDLEAWAFAPPPVWSQPAAVASDLPLAPASAPVAILDDTGRLHVLWSAAESANGPGAPGAALVYARLENGRWSTPAAILRAPEGKSDAPALVAAEDRLHAVWSGGADGRIYYSQAFARDATTAAGWSEALALSQAAGNPTAGSDPQILADLLGRLYVIYAVPLNEARGIYVTFSDDAGVTWSEPAVVFDAEAAGWLSVAQPSLSVDEQGNLLAVWARMPLPGNGPAEGLYSASSIVDGEFWTEPELLVEGAMTSPQAVATLKGQLLVIWYDAQRGAAAYRLSSDGGVTWSLTSQVPGLRSLQGPPAVATDGAGGIHLAAVVEESAAPRTLTLAHLLWDGERWTAEPSLPLARELQTVPGLALAASAPLGRLEALLVAQSAGAAAAAGTPGAAAPAPWSVLHTSRALPVAASAALPQYSRVTPTPPPAATPTPTPTPRPQVNPEAPQTGAPVVEAGPLSLPVIALAGIALALLMVVGLVVVQSRRR